MAATCRSTAALETHALCARSVVLEKIWWSKQPRRFDFTVATQLSTDRMPALFNQCTWVLSTWCSCIVPELTLPEVCGTLSTAALAPCRTYKGPMSAAVFLPLVQTEAEGPATKLSPENAAIIKQEAKRLDRLWNR